MKPKYLIISTLVFFSSLGLYGQIVMDCDGKVGFGSIANPEALIELEDQRWMMFNAHDNSSGILFHETGGKSEGSIQFGARIEYNESEDALILGSYNNWNAIDALWINRQDGGIGIGDNLWGSTYKLKVYGRAVTTYSVWETSDIRFKENIENIADEPKLLKQLRGVSFNRKQNINNTTSSTSVPETESSSQDNLSGTGQGSVELQSPVVPVREYGFIAQEVREVLPNLVIEDEEGYLAINYTGFIPLLVESCKSLQAKVESLENEIAVLKSNCCPESGLKSASSGDEIPEEGSVLFQNIPNPFSGNTRIGYSLAGNVVQATIYIYDINGTQLKRYELHHTGAGDITIQGNELKAGMYLYSLIADGQVIDTKRMVLTD